MVPPFGGAADDPRPGRDQPIYVWDPGTTPGSRGPGAAPGPRRRTPPWQITNSFTGTAAERAEPAQPPGPAGTDAPAEPSPSTSGGETGDSFRSAPLGGPVGSFSGGYPGDSFSIPGESTRERFAGADFHPRAYTSDSFSIPGDTATGSFHLPT